MKYLPLILGNILRRSLLRNLLTVFVVALAILLVSILSGVQAALQSGVDVADAKQLITRNKVSLIFPLPISYAEKIRSVPGVLNVAAANWFGGVYKDDQSYFFPRVAIQPEPFLDINPRYVLKPEEREAFVRDRGSCIVGDGTAQRFKLKVGDTLQLRGDIYPGEWSFVVRGIYTVQRAADDDTWMFFHWDYLNERLKTEAPDAADMAGWFALLIDDPGRAAGISKAVDLVFENSAYQTLTETEASFQMGFLKMFGIVEFMLAFIGVGVFLAMLMVAMNTMMMAARERTTEIGVLKSMGYPGPTMIGLVLAESVTIALIGAVLGTLASLLLEMFLRPMLVNFVPTFHVPVWAQALGIAVGILIGLVAGLIPAVRASRLHPVTALRSIH
jgi:putative ABC transport system permease protein